jgi:hypothetical protein
MQEEYKKYLPVIGLVVCGGLLLIIIINNYSGSIKEGGSSKTYQKSLSLDKLYDEAGGNDPLSDSIMTSQTDLSTEKYSCSFMTTYKGIKDRSVECMKGCNDDEGDENSNFCKQFEYPGGDDKLKDVFLDQTYTRRRGNRKIEDIEESKGNPCHKYPLRGDDTGNEIMKCNKGSDRATAECLGESFDGTDQNNYSNNCFGYDSSEKKFYNCKTESDGEGGYKLTRGEECEYDAQCDETRGENLDWVLETKKYMNEILEKCTADEMKTGSTDNTTEEEPVEEENKLLMIFHWITFALMCLLYIIYFFNGNVRKQLIDVKGVIIPIALSTIWSIVFLIIHLAAIKNKTFYIITLIVNLVMAIILAIVFYLRYKPDETP